MIPFSFDNYARSRDEAMRLGQEANAQAVRIANSAANRGVTSPAALASAASQASAAQRAQIVAQQAAMLRQGRQEDAQNIAGTIGQGINMAASLIPMFMSDEDSKEVIRDASRAIDQFLGSIDPQSFQYRDPQAPGAGPGRRTGVMAQDLQQSAVGRQMVRQGPGGQLAVDPQAAISALLASQARLNDRLADLEGRPRRNRDTQTGLPIREHSVDLREPALPGTMGGVRRAEQQRQQAALGREQRGLPPDPAVGLPIQQDPQRRAAQEDSERRAIATDLRSRNQVAQVLDRRRQERLDRRTAHEMNPLTPPFDFASSGMTARIRHEIPQAVPLVDRAIRRVGTAPRELLPSGIMQTIQAVRRQIGGR